MSKFDEIDEFLDVEPVDAPKNNKIEKVLDFKLPYESVAQTFNAQMGVTDIWRDIDFYKEKRVHSTQKPLKLIQRLILASSNEGDLVLDPFAGSGSTAIASLQLKRDFITIEADKDYYNEVLKRIESVENPSGNLVNASNI